MRPFIWLCFALTNGFVCAPADLVTRFPARARPQVPAEHMHKCDAYNDIQERQECHRGQALFQEVGLSRDGQVSCATCHRLPNVDVSAMQKLPVLSDGLSRPRVREHSLKGPRTPSLLDVGRVSGPYFWNGRARSLNDQPYWPLFADEELGATPDTLLKWGGAQSVALALATYMKMAFQSTRAPFDEWVEGKCDALNAREARGALLVLREKNCTHCHSGSELRGTQTHPLMYDSLPSFAYTTTESTYSADAALSVFAASHQKFRVLKSVPPSLRNLVWRGPPYGRFGLTRDLSLFLAKHSGQPQESALRTELTSQELGDVLAFLFIGLRSDQIMEAQ